MHGLPPIYCLFFNINVAMPYNGELQEGKLIFLVLLAQKGYWVFLETYEVETFALLKIISFILMWFSTWKNLQIPQFFYSIMSHVMMIQCEFGI